MATDDPLRTPQGIDEKELDALFGAELEDFVSERDALAKRLRAEDREAGEWVKGLRKPTVAAWAVNQATRREPGGLRQLLEAGDSLREAQELLTAGKGQANELRQRSRREEDAVGELTEVARSVLEKREGGAGDQVVERIRETFQAVSLDDQARRLVERGRLTHEVRAAGFGPLVSAASGAARPRKDPPVSDKPNRRDEQRVQRAQQAAEEAGDQRRAAEDEVKAATRERDQAQRRLDLANRKLERASGKEERSVEHLREAEAKLSGEASRS